jgi:hypothetical protein
MKVMRHLRQGYEEVGVSGPLGGAVGRVTLFCLSGD